MYYPNLEAEMARKGINRSKLATITGLRNTTMSNKLSGKSPLKFIEMKKIKRALNVDMAIDVLFYAPSEDDGDQSA